MTIHNRLINDRISMLLQESEQFKLEDRGNKFSKSIFDNGSLPQISISIDISIEISIGIRPQQI